MKEWRVSRGEASASGFGSKSVEEYKAELNKYISELEKVSTDSSCSRKGIEFNDVSMKDKLTLVGTTKLLTQGSM